MNAERGTLNPADNQFEFPIQRSSFSVHRLMII
jgi:hypothetical protein